MTATICGVFALACFCGGVGLDIAGRRRPAIFIAGIGWCFLAWAGVAVLAA